MSSSGRISPTAHYTGYVWARNGLSHPALASTEGRLMFESLRPLWLASRQLGGYSLESYLLTRHRAIDALLERAIDEHGITQVVEVAAGLSPRGWRFTQRYGDEITYVEADLPEMAARKRRALKQIGSLDDHHRVSEVDALSDASLDAVIASLDPTAGLAFVTEGLLGYLPLEAVEGIWRRFARALERFPEGRYISDLHVGEMQSRQIRAFRLALSVFVRGSVHLHFDNAGQARDALLRAGFNGVDVLSGASLVPQTRGAGSGLVHIIEASTV